MRERGFSLVEVMIAIIVLTVGVLAMAATSGAVVRLVAGGGRMGGSAVVADARLETLRRSVCVSMPGAMIGGSSSGSATTGRYSEAWTVTASGWLRTVRLTVSYANGRTTRSDVYETMISCAG